MLVKCLIALTICLYIYLLWKKRNIYKLGNSLKCGVTALPFIGHSYLFHNDIARMTAIQTLGRDAIKKDNGLTAFWVASHLFTLIADPEAAQTALKECLEKDDIVKLTTLFFGNGSIFAPVSIWKPRRKVVMPTFSAKNLKNFVLIFNKQSRVLIEQMDKVTGTGLVSAWKYYTCFTMDSIAEALLGYEFHAQNKSSHPFLEAFDTGFNATAKRLFAPWLHSDVVFNNLPIYKTLLGMKNYMWGFIKELIEAKREEIKRAEINGSGSDESEGAQGKAKSFLELLVRLSGKGEGFTDIEMIEELMVLMMAGNDTTAVSLCFINSMLSRHPEVQEKVYEELQEVFGDSDRPATWEDLPNLKYLDAVIRETLRLYTPVPIIARKVDKEVTLPSGLKLLPGTGILVNIWALHRNPRYWGEDADQFRPERFIDTPLKHPAAFMPFSNGPRNCLGYQFAIMTAKLVMSSVLRHFKILPAFKPINSTYPPLRLKYDIMMKDADECQIMLERRNK